MGRPTWSSSRFHQNDMQYLSRYRAESLTGATKKTDDWDRQSRIISKSSAKHDFHIYFFIHEFTDVLLCIRYMAQSWESVVICSSPIRVELQMPRNCYVYWISSAQWIQTIVPEMECEILRCSLYIMFQYYSYNCYNYSVKKNWLKITVIIKMCSEIIENSRFSAN